MTEDCPKKYSKCWFCIHTDIGWYKTTKEVDLGMITPKNIRKDVKITSYNSWNSVYFDCAYKSNLQGSFELLKTQNGCKNLISYYKFTFD